MNGSGGNDVRIGPVSPQGQPEALRLVLGPLASDDLERQRELLGAGGAGGERSLPGLFGAYRAGLLVGAVFSQLQPGKTALVWPPRIAQGEPAQTASKLLSAACDRLADQHVCLAQVLLEADASSDVPMLRNQGFSRLADLLYLVSPEDQFPTSRPSGPLAFESYRPANRDRLARVVEATYCQTLDCPRLGGVRHLEDVLAGYRATGVFDAQRWLIVRHQDRDVGCLLLADHPEHGNWELVYMGLVVSARGRGWGVQMARQAQWRTRRAGRPRLVLAVDAANQPAIKTYAAVGFHPWDRRTAYVKLLHGSR